MRTYLISLQEKPFKAILAGIKRYEFRKRFSKTGEPFSGVIYLTRPAKKIVGIVDFDAAIFDTIENLLDLARVDNYPFIDAVKEYFQGVNRGFALPIKKVRLLKETIPLDRLREIVPGFVPPQSYYSIDNPKYKIIREVVIKDGS